MAVILSQTQDLTPPSPSLTNPDMILPYSSRFRDADSPSRKQIPRSIGISSLQGDSWTPPLSQKSSRPSLPGAWQSEEDMRPITSNGGNLHPNGAGHRDAGPKSPAAKFLNTLDPKLRAGLGVELPEYSPSIYSPTESELAQKSPYTNEMHTSPEEQLDEVKAILEDDDNLLSMRAEEILANAKKRLTVRIF
jgi:hypothetical protein